MHPNRTYLPPRNRRGEAPCQDVCGALEGSQGKAVKLRTANDFSACILRVQPGTVETKKIMQRISQCLDLWEEGRIEALVSDVESTAVASTTKSRRAKDKESEARCFHFSVLAGKLRSAVRALTARTGGSVWEAHDVCTKLGQAGR